MFDGISREKSISKMKRQVLDIEKIKDPLRVARYKYWIFKEKCLGVDFTKQANLEDLKLSNQRSMRYHAVTPRLKRLLKKLNISERDMIVDLGCGKGKALYYMAGFPFKRIYGVELSEQLVEIAKKNMQHYGIKNVNIVCVDAGEFNIPIEINYIYMFNPFPVAVIKEILQNIKRSLEIKDRKITIIYLNPVCEKEIIEEGIFQKKLYWKNYAIYANK